MRFVSDDSSPSDNPFGGMPFFGNLGNMFGGQGGDPWANAKQIATGIANGERTEDNVDPSVRIAFEQLARVAELQIQQTSGLRVSDGTPPTIRPATRHEWAVQTLDAYRPLLETMSESLSKGMSDLTAETNAVESMPEIPGLGAMGGDFMAQIMGMLGPMMLSMTAGSMVGSLSRSSLGSYDLPLPRSASRELLVVNASITEFTDEWQVPTDDMRLWVCLHEYLHHAVLSISHVEQRLRELTTEYVGSFEANPGGMGGALGSFDLSNPESLSSVEGLMNDPEALMGVVQSDHQRALLPEISALLATIVGWVDHMMDRIGSTLIGSYAMLSEALRRRRVTASPSDRFLERMLGLELDQTCYEQGRSFVDGVVERAGDDGLARLWQSTGMLPNPNEIVAPGLWLARIDLDTHAIDSAGSTADEEE